MTNTRVRISSLLLATAIALSGLLSACGDDDSNKSDSSDESSQTTDESSDATEGTESEEPTESTESEEAPEPAEDAAGKPSRDDVIAGYTKIVKDNGKQAGMDMPDSIANKVVTCFVDDVYDEASPETLQALADADPTGVQPSDAKLFTNASTTCAKAIS
ncbi:hypothetical protein ASG90_13245 [Nocardioides sp. Soil797]|nr:hypothetical protein ASG90_13245 [Nocardioides sp. Soil797]